MIGLIELIIFLVIGFGSIFLVHIKMKKKDASFIQMMIIVAIISILAALIVPGFFGSKGQGRFTCCQSNCKNIGTALEMYAEDNGGHYPTSMDKLIPTYMKAIPTCISGGKDTYSETYQVFIDPKNSKNDRFTFYCSGENHGAVGVKGNYPQYSSSEGLIARKRR